MWASRRNNPAGAAVMVCCCAAGLMMADHAHAAIEYDALSLFAMPQPAFDISQGRPDLELRRPQVGAINSQGDLAGRGDAGSTQNFNQARPFFYHHQAATVANLGDLTGDFADPTQPLLNWQSEGLGINDAGWVVGVSSTTTDSGIADDRPFLWADQDANQAHNPGEMHELQLNPGATRGAALRINNTGQALINGDTGLYLANLSLNAGTLSETTPRILIAPNALVGDLNESGHTAYTTDTAGFVWRDLNDNNLADPSETSQIPFMSAAFPNSQAFAINNAGQVVGTMRNDQGQNIAFLWTDLDNDNQIDWIDANANGFFEHDETSTEVVRFHGDPAGINAADGHTFAKDLNDLGQVVGAYIDSSGNRKAFIYEADLGLRFLDDLSDPAINLQLRQADAINNAGQIAVFGRTLGGLVDQLVLLSPINPLIAGDLDGNGFVDILDLNIVLANWNTDGSADPRADTDGNGLIDILDLNVVLTDWNMGTPPAGSAVPEPGTFGLLAVGGWGIGGGRLRGREYQKYA